MAKRRKKSKAKGVAAAVVVLIAVIVGLFFGLCLAVSAFGLWFVGLFGKSDKAEDYGFEPENAEETKKED